MAAEQAKPADAVERALPGHRRRPSLSPKAAEQAKPAGAVERAWPGHWRRPPWGKAPMATQGVVYFMG